MPSVSSIAYTNVTSEYGKPPKKIPIFPCYENEVHLNIYVHLHTMREILTGSPVPFPEYERVALQNLLHIPCS